MNNANTVPTPSWLKWMYRITTGSLIAWMLSSGIMALSRAAPIVEAISRLGYPSYFSWLLGLAKTGGALLLLLPVPRGLGSWVYAGATLELLSAAFSYAASGASVAEVAVPLGFLVLVHLSFWSWRRQGSRVEPSQPRRRMSLS
ncbi:MAG: DoxX family protein [Myxococcota bacterium]